MATTETKNTTEHVEGANDLTESLTVARQEDAGSSSPMSPPTHEPSQPGHSPLLLNALQP